MDGAPGTRPKLNGQMVHTTDVDCPHCAAAGVKNLGGQTPKLRHIEGDPRVFCVGLHGYI